MCAFTPPPCTAHLSSFSFLFFFCCETAAFCPSVWIIYNLPGDVGYIRAVPRSSNCTPCSSFPLHKLGPSAPCEKYLPRQSYGFLTRNVTLHQVQNSFVSWTLSNEINFPGYPPLRRFALSESFVINHQTCVTFQFGKFNVTLMFYFITVLWTPCNTTMVEEALV